MVGVVRMRRYLVVAIRRAERLVGVAPLAVEEEDGAGRSKGQQCASLFGLTCGFLLCSLSMLTCGVACAMSVRLLFSCCFSLFFSLVFVLAVADR